MRVQDLINVKGDSVITVTESIRVKEAARVMHERAVGALVVVTPAGQLKGVVSEREIVVALARHGTDALNLQATDLMLDKRPVVSPSDSVRDAMTTMTERRVRHLPVVFDGRVVATDQPRGHGQGAALGKDRREPRIAGYRPLAGRLGGVAVSRRPDAPPRFSGRRHTRGG